MSEDGLGRGDAAMTGQGQIEASAHAVTFDGGGDWGGIGGDGAHEGLSEGGERVGGGSGEGGDFVEVGAYGEEAAIAGDDEGMLVGVVFQFVSERFDGLD